MATQSTYPVRPASMLLMTTRRMRQATAGARASGMPSTGPSQKVATMKLPSSITKCWQEAEKTIPDVEAAIAVAVTRCIDTKHLSATAWG